MNYIDIFISILLITGIIRGFMRGFIYEIAILGAILICFFLGFKIATYFSPHISELINVSEPALRYISLFVVWTGITILAVISAKLFEGLINIVALGVFNKIAGAIFGGLKFAFIIGLFLFFFNKADAKYRILNADTKADSVFYYPMLNAAKGVFPSMLN